jgi:hypothetical protein
MYLLDRLYVVLDLGALIGDGGCEVLIHLLQLVIALGQLSDHLFEPGIRRFEPVYLRLKIGIRRFEFLNILSKYFNFLQQFLNQYICCDVMWSCNCQWADVGWLS